MLRQHLAERDDASGPKRPAIDRYLNPGDGCKTADGEALHEQRPRRDGLVGQRIGNLAGYLHRRLVREAENQLVRAEGQVAVGSFDAGDPLDAPVAVVVEDHQADGAPVLAGERATAHVRHQQRLVRAGGKVAVDGVECEVVGIAISAVEAEAARLFAVEAGAVEKEAEGDAAPERGAGEAGELVRVGDTAHGLEDGERAAGFGLQVGQGQRQRRIDQPVNREGPRGRIEVRHGPAADGALRAVFHVEAAQSRVHVGRCQERRLPPLDAGRHRIFLAACQRSEGQSYHHAAGAAQKNSSALFLRWGLAWHRHT